MTNDMPQWNLYLEKVGINSYRLIMPTEEGIMIAPCPQHGYAIRWPLNPHFTGERGIIELLRATDKFFRVNITWRS